MEKAILSKEPVENWNCVEYYMPVTSSSDDYTDTSMRSTDSMIKDSQRASLASSVRSSVFSINNNILKSLVRVSERPSELNTLHDVQVNDFKNEISCFL